MKMKNKTQKTKMKNNKQQNYQQKMIFLKNKKQCWEKTWAFSVKLH